MACVVLTNADVDHIGGLLTMRESQAFAIYASDRIQAALRDNPIFNVVNPKFVERRSVTLDQPEPLAGPEGEPIGLTVEPFAVPGKIALYLEKPEAGTNFGTVEGDTIGLHITQPETGAELFYIPGCAKVDAPLADRLRGAPLILFDGSLYGDGEMISAGLGVKTGNRMGHMSISGPDGTLAAFAELDVKRRIFIHINNSNPILIEDSPERAAVEQAGWEVASDGLEIVL